MWISYLLLMYYSLFFKQKAAYEMRISEWSSDVCSSDLKNVLMVERGPFLEQDGGSFAWVVEGGSATRRPIQDGASSLSNVEIVSGLEEGDRIVVSGTDKFGNAEQVRLNGE